LVAQNPKDEPASELLKKIKAEKEKLIAENLPAGKAGKLKKEKELPPIKPEEIPFEIPENWSWCRLGEICIHITDGEHVTPQKQKEGRLLLSAKNIRDGFIVYDNVDYISEEDFQKSIKRCKPEKSDVLIVSVGGTIGRSTVMNDDVEFAIVRSVALIKPFIKLMANYIKFILDSPILQKEINGRSWGTAQPCLYINQIKELTIPLPPMEEQNRIVQKLDELMQYCNELETSIKQSESQNEKLLQQVLREALRKEPVEV
jgi:type I restriction enzyme S subunit